MNVRLCRHGDVFNGGSNNSIGFEESTELVSLLVLALGEMVPTFTIAC